MILLLSDDLLDASKTIAHGRAAGHVVIPCKSVAALIERLGSNEAACCIIDLQLPQLDLEELMGAISRSSTTPRVIAYGSHVDAARLNAARKAGCDEVMPRSQYFEVMPQRLATWGC